MAFRHPLGFLASEVFPPLDRHIDVGGVDLDGIDAPSLLLAGNDCGARANERVVDVAFVIMDSPLLLRPRVSLDT